ncbi:dehydrogenase E1 component subunit alpha/beta [soil metagenome]
MSSPFSPEHPENDRSRGTAGNENGHDRRTTGIADDLVFDDGIQQSADDEIAPDGAQPSGGQPAEDHVEQPADEDVQTGNTSKLAGYEGDLDVTPVGPEDFEPEQLRQALRTMMLSRRLDEKMLTLLKQGKGFFHIGCAGHEAAQVGLGMHLKGGHDWFCMYYRDLSMTLTLGMTSRETMLAHMAKADDVSSGGRQMSEHFGNRELNILSTSSSVGAQFLPGVGFALASQRRGDDSVTYISCGEGATSQGAFHEGLNWSARAKAPALFHVQDNKFAISVPVSEQTAGGSIYDVTAGYQGLSRAKYDGTDFFTTYAVSKAAVEHIRAGNGPVVLVADVVRLLPHSSSDDHLKYRSKDDVEFDRTRDPIARFSQQLVEAGVLSDDDVEALRKEVSQEVDAAAEWAAQQADPDPETALKHVYSENPPDLTFHQGGPDSEEAGDLVVMVDAINHALREEMTRDERVIVYGEDVGGGKGGVFTATRGLTETFGVDRCFNSPLAEHSIVGSAVGLSAAGFKPVVEIQFADYIWPAMQQLRNQVAPMRYRSENAWSCPMVIRVPCGGYIHGGLCHSQNIEAFFAHFPGVHVVMPSTAADAKGLLKTAIRSDDPILFLEHKALYRQGPARSPEPTSDYLLPFGEARIVREGSDLTIVTYGAMVYKALNVAKQLEREGVSVEVIDLRTMLPFDQGAVLKSVRKTGRAVVLYEDHEFMGFGAEIAAQISSLAFQSLDAPVKRVAGKFTYVPFADPLERAVLPQDDWVLDGARKVLAF